MDVPSRRTGGIYFEWTVLVHILYAHDDDGGVEAIMPIASLKKTVSNPPVHGWDAMNMLRTCYTVYQVFTDVDPPLSNRRVFGQYAHHQQ